MNSPHLQAVSVPFNIEIEQRVLGAILYGNNILADIELSPTHCFEPLHQRILAVALQRIEEGRPATSVTLIEDFALEPPINDRLGVPAYLARLEDSVGLDDLKNFRELVRQLKELAAWRDLLDIGLDLVEASRHRGVSPLDVGQDAVGRLDGLAAAQRLRRRSLVSVHDAAMRALEQALSPDKDPPAPSGFVALDRLIGGFHRGETTLLAGRPGMGKTAMGISIARGAAASGRGVLYFSLEMTAAALGGRCGTDAAFEAAAPIAYKDLRRGGLDEEAARRLLKALKKLHGLPLFIDESPGLCISEVMSRSRRLADQFDRAGKKLGLIVIDHLGKLKPSTRYAGNTYAERSEISGLVAEMAKSLDVPVLALHQLSRGVESREDKRPLMSDLRDSGRLEEDADNILLVYREAYYLERARYDDPAREAARLLALDDARNRIEVIVAKQRAGDTGILTLFADMGSNAIRDLAAAR